MRLSVGSLEGNWDYMEFSDRQPAEGVQSCGFVP